MADERSYEYTPPEFSMADETTSSTSCGGTPGASSALDAYNTIPDDAWKYPWNTQPMPITDGTYSVEGDAENGMTSYQELGCVSSIENARPSTIRAGMDAASANFEDGATIPETTLVDPLRRQYHPAHSRSTICVFEPALDEVCQTTSWRKRKQQCGGGSGGGSSSVCATATKYNNNNTNSSTTSGKVD
ncbi:uncharacterized protein [Dermacentor andersoni]|uniref:uncharacterized protein n=1 Tax=Dermacentor andersoni TaxID=34620 RepID=UPI003B3AF94B